jgi:hypothetical protein
MKHVFAFTSRAFVLCLGLLLVASVCVAQNSPLWIVDIPRPALPADYGTLDTQGAVRLKVQFMPDGTVGAVLPVTRLPDGLTDLAIETAKRIRFEPQRENGKTVTAWNVIEYVYGWEYSGWKVPTNATPDPRAEAIIQKAVQFLGGEKYLNVKTQIGRGKYSTIRDGAVVAFQTFTDIIVYPNKERTEFKGGGSKIIQTNVGDTGWVFDGGQELVKDQNEKQIESYKRGIRSSLDYLLRGQWKGEAELSYIGKRQGTLGKRNDVIKLVYKDGFEIEFEFADDGTPVKGGYKRTSPEGEEVKEEDRYAQFIDVGGIKAPFIIDRFTGSTQSSRINYETIEFNKSVSDSIFAKPSSGKDAKKDAKP